MRKKICDKCGGEVQIKNNAPLVLHLATGRTHGVLQSVSRHLLPVTDEKGKNICIGSPSLAQYIEGQPRDQRPEFTYNPKMESQVREAFKMVQDKSFKPSGNATIFA